MVRGFADASVATKGNGPSILGIAGFISTIPAWCRFEEEERKIRREFGLEFFHMTDYMSVSGKAKPYCDWSDTKRDLCMDRIIHNINKNVMFGVAFAINLSDIDKEREKHQNDPLWSGNNPYMFCTSQFFTLTKMALESNHINEQVLWIFESGDQGQKEFIWAMQRICTLSEKFREWAHIFSVMPGTKKQFPGLDAADFLAWETPQHVQRMITNAPHRPSSYIRRIRRTIYDRYLHGSLLLQFISAADVTLENVSKVESHFSVWVKGKKKIKRKL